MSKTLDLYYLKKNILHFLFPQLYIFPHSFIHSTYIYQVPALCQKILGPKVHQSTKPRSLSEHLHSKEGKIINIINTLNNEHYGKKKKQARLKRTRWEVWVRLSHSYRIHHHHVLKSQLFFNIHLKCHLLYEAFLSTLVKSCLSHCAPLALPISIIALSICLVLNMNASVFSLDCNSLIKRMCLINHFIPFRVTQ